MSKEIQCYYMMFMAKRNDFINATIVIVCALIFFSCDSYHSRKKIISELSSLYNENRTEFDKIHEYFLSDSLSKRFVIDYQSGKIDVDDGNNTIAIDAKDQMKNNSAIYQILAFMKREKIRIISGSGNEGWITFAFEGRKFPCFNFWYRSDFNPEDENVKREVENIKNAKTKNWIYILDKKGWYVRGVKCF